MDKFEYIKSLKKYIIFSLIVFLLGFAEGYSFPQSYPKEAEDVIAQVREMFGPALEAGGSQVFIFIFFKNVLATAIAIVSGVLGGLIPVMSVLSNGFLVGLVGFYSVERSSWLAFFSGIAPHGVFELPAFFLSAAIGIKLGKVALSNIYSYLRRWPPETRKSLIREFLKAANLFISVLLPLLLVAALVETYITPKIIELSMGL